MSKETNDFLWFSYFKITKTDAELDKDTAFDKCVFRAYLDSCRHFPYKYSNSMLKNESINFQKEYDKKKNKFIADITEQLSSQIKDLEKIHDQTGFNEWHKNICKLIKIISRDRSELFLQEISYGQAQKWLNMTLKNMLYMELWSDIFKEIKWYLHAPVDRIIINAAWDLNVSKSTKIIQLPLLDGINGFEKYDDSKVLSWNNWKENDYSNFQDSLRKYVNESNYSCPIEWEHDNWIKYSK